MRRYRFSLVCTPISGPKSKSIYVCSLEPNAYVRAQVFLQGSPDLTGAAVVSVSGDHPYDITVTDNGSAQDYRLVPSDTGLGFMLAIDGGATFTDGEVVADVYLEAPPGFGFIQTNDGGAGFIVTLQALQPD